MLRKLRILFIEVGGFGLLIAWLMWKYPELIDDVIPWVALVIVWHVTWEYILDTPTFRRWAFALGKKTKPMIAWSLVFLLGGSVSLLYWKGIDKSLRRLSSIAEARAIAKRSKQTTVTTPPENKPQLLSEQHGTNDKATAKVERRTAAKTQIDPFYLAVGPTMNSPNRAMLGEITGAFEQQGKYTIVPLNVAVYMTITNLQPIQSEIEKYLVEIKTRRGSWVNLTRIESRNFEFYSIADHPHKSVQVELTLLDKQLSERWLQPHETVKGWTFFQYPPDSDREGFLHVFRLTIGDAAGVIFVSKELSAKDNEGGVQGATLKVLPGQKDLSAAEWKYIE